MRPIIIGMAGHTYRPRKNGADPRTDRTGDGSAGKKNAQEDHDRSGISPGWIWKMGCAPGSSMSPDMKDLSEHGGGSTGNGSGVVSDRSR